MSAEVHLVQLTRWQSASGKWYVNDVKNLAGRSAKWYTPMRILNLSIEDYINLLLYTFHAKGVYYYAPTDYLSFYFSTENDAKAFCLYINRYARYNNYCCA